VRQGREGSRGNMRQHGGVDPPLWRAPLAGPSQSNTTGHGCFLPTSEGENLPTFLLLPGPHGRTRALGIQAGEPAGWSVYENFAPVLWVQFPCKFSSWYCPYLVLIQGHQCLLKWGGECSSFLLKCFSKTESKLDRVIHSCSPSTQEIEVGGLRV
jgi:hypothetical protein